MSPQPATKSATIVVVEDNDFKQFNDTHGHLAGDSVLLNLAGLFRISHSYYSFPKNDYAAGKLDKQIVDLLL